MKVLGGILQLKLAALLVLLLSGMALVIQLQIWGHAQSINSWSTMPTLSHKLQVLRVRTRGTRR